MTTEHPPTRKWSEEERNQVLKLVNAGFSQSEIADRLRRSTSAIAKCVQIFRASGAISKPPANRYWTEAEDSKMMALRAQGLGWGAIGTTMGRTAKGVELRYANLKHRRPANEADELGEDMTRQPWTSHEDEAVRIGLEKGETFRQIGQTIKRSTVAVACRVQVMRRSGRLPAKSAVPTWPDADIATLCEMIAAGHKVPEIATALDRSERSVRHALETLRRSGPTSLPNGVTGRSATQHNQPSSDDTDFATSLLPARTRDGLPSLAARLVANTVAAEVRAMGITQKFLEEYARDNSIRHKGDDLLACVNRERRSYGLPPFHIATNQRIAE